MANNIINVRTKQKRDTEANWIAKNPVLLYGELAFSSDAGDKYKIGNGTSKWADLAYILPSKAEIGLGNVENTKDANKVVKSATSATNDSAGNQINTTYVKKNNTNDMYGLINSLGTGNSTPQDADFYIAQYAGGGTTTKTYYRRPISALWEYMKSKIDAAGYKTTDTNTWRGIQNNLTSTSTTDSLSAAQGKELKSLVDLKLNSTDISDWAKATTKPTYTKSEIGLSNVNNTADANKTVNKANTIIGQYTGNGGQLPPSIVGNSEVKFRMWNAFKGLSPLWNGYLDAIVMDTYSGKDVPWTTSLGILKANGTPRAFIATGAKGDSSTWKNQTEIITSGNIGSQSVLKATQDASGNVITSTYAKKSIYEDTTINLGRLSNTTIGTNSAVVGCFLTASGVYSFAQGDGSSATGAISHAEGESTTAEGAYSHSEGLSTNALGTGSHAEGDSSSAEGEYSHAEGISTKAIHDGSHAEGYYTIANGNYQHVSGKYNIKDEDDKYAYIIGGGTADDSRKNIFTVDWNGHTNIAGGLAADSIEFFNSAPFIDFHFGDKDRTVGKDYTSRIIESAAGKLQCYAQWDVRGILSINGVNVQTLGTNRVKNVTSIVTSCAANTNTRLYSFQVDLNGNYLIFPKFRFNCPSSVYVQAVVTTLTSLPYPPSAYGEGMIQYGCGSACVFSRSTFISLSGNTTYYLWIRSNAAISSFESSTYGWLNAVKINI